MKIDFVKHIKTGRRVHAYTLWMSKQEILKIKVNAIRFTDGNVAEWMRYASTVLLPPPNHIKFDSVPEEENDLYNKDYGQWQILPEQLEELKKKAIELEETENASQHKMRGFKQTKARRTKRTSGRSEKPVKTKLPKTEEGDS